MFLISYIWLENKFHVVISESASFHNKALTELKIKGGSLISSDCYENRLGTVIVNGKRSVWPLTKSEGADLDV
ncbi:hypothetical protein C2H96_01735 [Bacillus subtilis]|nr:hypothetical protein Q433_09975 [Bacillus subtilis subsp. subtilis str. OH 131.1]UQZ53300.1 hypothetical protein C2H96_01735 [Bacillus subtilis]UQZ68321.1 hypothetical protein C2H97_18530 [Bacillus subtilis PY79]UQZ72728.1 hypothetical protein C2I05_20495 [Bacillus subtilis]